MQDPIDVGDDLDRAVELLAEGKHIRLNQPDQVVIIAAKLAQIGADAKAKGEKAPDYNLCDITVKGTNLFCHDHKGIPRVEMPQLGGIVPDEAPAAMFRMSKGKPAPDDPDAEADLKPAFTNALIAAGIKTTDTQKVASHLRATQSELGGVQVGGMAQAIRDGKIKIGDEGTRIFVTRDGYILDGHHGWAAQVILDSEDQKLGDVMMNVTEMDIDIGTALDYANAFSKTMGVPQRKSGVSIEDARAQAAAARAAAPQAKGRWMYVPDARDADLDMIVQEGTPFERAARPRAPRVTSPCGRSASPTSPSV